MPHYKDGTLAKVGDRVVGPTYNRGGVPEEGVLVQITSGGDVCNCRVWIPTRIDGDKVYAEGADYGEVRAFEKLPEE